MQNGTGTAIGIAPAAGVAAAPVGTRIGAAVVDLLPTLLLMPFFLIPVIGQIVGGFFYFLYWLLRDVFGRSLGKKLLGLAIVDSAGNQAGGGALVLRNLTLSFSFLLYMIPFAGYAMFIATEPLVNIVELILVVATSKRLGDRLAGTTVISAG